MINASKSIVQLLPHTQSQLMTKRSSHVIATGNLLYNMSCFTQYITIFALCTMTNPRHYVVIVVVVSVMFGVENYYHLGHVCELHAVRIQQLRPPIANVRESSNYKSRLAPNTPLERSKCSWTVHIRAASVSTVRPQFLAPKRRCTRVRERAGRHNRHSIRHRQLRDSCWIVQIVVMSNDCWSVRRWQFMSKCGNLLTVDASRALHRETYKVRCSWLIAAFNYTMWWNVEIVQKFDLTI